MATRNPTVLVSNPVEKSQKSPPSRLLTSFRPNPILILFPPYPSHAVQVYSFSPGVQAILGSLGWGMTSSVNFISQLGTNGWSRVWQRANLDQSMGQGWSLSPLVDCIRCLLTRMARCVIPFVRSIAMGLFYCQVWSCGTNDDAALGRVTSEVPDPDKPGEFLDVDTLTATPHPVQSLVDENFRAVRIAAGDSISAAISTNGDLRAWGHFRVCNFFAPPICDRSMKP